MAILNISGGNAVKLPPAEEYEGVLHLTGPDKKEPINIKSIQWDSGYPTKEWQLSTDKPLCACVDNTDHLYYGTYTVAANLFKVNNRGNRIWSATCQNTTDKCIAIDKTAIYYGSSCPYKYNASGSLVWSKPDYNQVKDVCTLNSQVWFEFPSDIKVFTSNGGLVATYGNPVYPVGSNAITAHDGHIYIVGKSSSSSTNGRLCKMDSSGTQSWTITVGKSLDDIELDSAGNIYTVGEKTLYKVNQDKQTVWSYTSTISTLSLTHIVMDDNEDIYIGGSEEVILKLNKNGEVLWDYMQLGRYELNAIAISPIRNRFYAGNRDSISKFVQPTIIDY